MLHLARHRRAPRSPRARPQGIGARGSITFLQAVEAFDDRRWDEAYELAVELAMRRLDHAPSYHLAGLCALERRQWNRALSLLHRAACLDPGEPAFVVHWARALLLTDNLGEALKTADGAMALAPMEPALLRHLGRIFAGCQAHRRAIAAFAAAVKARPFDADLRYELALTHANDSNRKAARIEFRRAVALDPGHAAAQYGLSCTESKSHAPDRVASLRRRLTVVDDDPAASLRLHMAVGREWERVGRFDEAWAAYCRAKAPLQANALASLQRMKRLVTAMTDAFPESERIPASFRRKGPIFVLGMPHAGLRWVERLLTSHPGVHSIGATPSFGMAFKAMTRTGIPSAADLAAGRAGTMTWYQQLGERYLHLTRRLADGSSRYVDCFPHNSLYIGYIARALPGATIISVHRQPLDLCLSTFRALHPENDPFYAYTFDLEAIGRYYSQHERLMRHWHHVLPGRIHQIAYEDLVSHPEPTVHRLLESCHLDPRHALSIADENASLDVSRHVLRRQHFMPYLDSLRTELPSLDH